MKINTLSKFSLLLFIALFVAISCKNGSNNAAEMFTFESTVTPSNAGTVSPSGGSYESGEQLQVTASPNGGWVFKEWNGDFSGSDNPASVTISKNMSINALFEQLSYPLTVEVEGDGEVSEQIVNAKTDYTEGTTVQLTANPAENWEFVEWSGDLSGPENPTTITMDQAKTVTAVFQEIVYPLTITIEGEGEVSEEIVNGKTDYTQGTMVELIGNAANEWRFVEWTGDLESEENPATVTMDGPKNINAIFEFGFNEDFEEETADNWLFSDNRFSIAEGELRFSSGRDDNWGGAYYDQQFSDFRIEARITRTKSKGTIDNSLSLFLRSTGFMSYETPVSGYEFNITQDGSGSVWKIKNGVESNLIPWVDIKQLKRKLGESNTIAINMKGNMIDIYVNGEHIIGFKDESFSKGFAGIAIYAGDDGDNEAVWDYVKLLPPDTVEKPLQPSMKIIQSEMDRYTGGSSHHNHQ